MSTVRDLNEPGMSGSLHNLDIPTPSARSNFGSGWPVFGILYGYVLLWLLGLSALIWPIAAVFMILYLWTQRHVYRPPGLGIWLLFLGWMMLSAIGIDTVSSALVFTYRAMVYISVAVLLVYVYNLSPREVPTRRLVSALAFFWVSVIVLGILAMLAPGLQFRSLVEGMLPRSITSIGFVRNLIHPVMAQVQDFLGPPVARPAAPFTFTNQWGATVALLAPMFWLWTQNQTSLFKRTLGTLILILSLIPIVRSLNRGLWLSLGVAVVYAAVRFALQGRVKPLILITTAVALGAVLILTSPLAELVTQRAESGHSDERRTHLVEKSLDATMESPLVGYGIPIPDVASIELVAAATADEERWFAPPIGTHGQLWLVLVSHGIPATILFVAFLLFAVWFTRGPISSPTVFWSHITILIAVIELPFYMLSPAQLPLIAVVIAMAMRELRPPLGHPIETETSLSYPRAGELAGTT